MLITSDPFVADVTKVLMANLALYVVVFTLFHIYGFALVIGTKCGEFYVYPLYVLV